MGKGWFGVAFVFCLSGCGDDEPSWVPPEEDAGALETESIQDSTLESVTAEPVTSVETDAGGTNEVSTHETASFGDAGVRTVDAAMATSGLDAATTEQTGTAAEVTIADSGVAESETTRATSGSFESATTASNSTPLDAAVSELSSEAGVSVASDAGNSETSSSSADGAPDGGAQDAGSVEPIAARAGYIEVEAVPYSLLGSSYETSSAKLFYAFTPADELPEEAPVFVFFNGGPGSATSSGLLSYGTGPHSLPSDLSSPDLSPNPWSWTQMGNLLYFDTRQAGFSYSTLPDPSDANARAVEWNERNYNLYVDAADSIRLVLRVLSEQVELRDNPIVLVGESYGGTRATMMLRFLLDPELLRSANVFQDISLADEITSFFEANVASGTVQAQARRQLPAQVLIQPFFAANQFPDQDEIRCLPDSPAQQVAAELSTTCESIELYRDAYKINEPATWSDTLDRTAQQMLTHPTKLPSLLGVELNTITGLAAQDRGGAYRDFQYGSYADPEPEFVATLGELQSWDAYHVTLTPRAPWSDSTYTDPYPCYFFSWVAQQVDTFITNAKWDNVVLTPVLPTTLYECSQLAVTPFVDSVAFVPEGLTMGESGKMVLQFNELAPEGESQAEVEIRGYESGHMVTVTHAEPLLTDVRAFLVARGVL